MTSQCRACLNSNSADFIQLSSIFIAEETYFDCFNECTQLQSSMDDNLPQVVCENCLYILRTCYNFIKMAQKSDSVLRNITKETETLQINNLTLEDTAVEDMTVFVLEPLSTEVLEDNNEAQPFEETTLNCKICKIFFETQTQLEQHLQDEHTGVERVEGFIALATCELCQTFFESAEILDLHMLILHTNNSANFCVLCNETSSDIKEHLRQSHINEYTKIFENIVESSSTHEGLNENCKNPDAGNISENEANTAKKLMDIQADNQKSIFCCSFCSLAFKNRKSLRCHEKLHFEEEENQDTAYNCADCNRKFNKLALFEQHRKNAHKNREFSCKICGNSFKLKNQLNNHLKLHLEKNINCPYCDKKYARRFDLNVHLRTHSGELPYECHLCEKKFAIKVRLTYHLQKHAGFKHKCKECDAEFNSRLKLKAHTFKHTGMPYRCELCHDHGFNKRDVFKRHLLRVHNATITEESLLDMFQRNTGKAPRVRAVNAIYD